MRESRCDNDLLQGTAVKKSAMYISAVCTVASIKLSLTSPFPDSL